MEIREYTLGMQEGNKKRKVLGYYAQGHVDKDRFLAHARGQGIRLMEPRHTRWSVFGDRYFEVESGATGSFPVTLALVSDHREEQPRNFAKESRDRRIKEILEWTE